MGGPRSRIERGYPGEQDGEASRWLKGCYLEEDAVLDKRRGAHRKPSGLHVIRKFPLRRIGIAMSWIARIYVTKRLALIGITVVHLMQTIAIVVVGNKLPSRR